MSLPTEQKQVPQGYRRSTKNEISGCAMGIAYSIMGMLFLSGLILYLVLRAESPVWPPEHMPRIPSGMWLSTLVLLLSSASLHLAFEGARSTNRALLRISMLVTLALGATFLVLQVLNWIVIWKPAIAIIKSFPVPQTYGLVYSSPHITPAIYLDLFYILTGLHAAHVVGGVIWLTLGSVAAFRGWYVPGNLGGMRALGHYWHFLDVVWVVLFLTLQLTT